MGHVYKECLLLQQNRDNILAGVQGSGRQTPTVGSSQAMSMSSSLDSSEVDRTDAREMPHRIGMRNKDISAMTSQRPTLALLGISSSLSHFSCPISLIFYHLISSDTTLSHFHYTSQHLDPTILSSFNSPCLLPSSTIYSCS